MEIEESGWGIMASEHLGNVIEQFFPHPRRFRLVWTHQQGDKPLYTWRAVPPGPPGRSLFVAMGMVVTTTEDEPDLTSIRCMPKAWVQESPVPPRKIWDDSGPLSAMRLPAAYPHAKLVFELQGWADDLGQCGL